MSPSWTAPRSLEGHRWNKLWNAAYFQGWIHCCQFSASNIKDRQGPLFKNAKVNQLCKTSAIHYATELDTLEPLAQQARVVFVSVRTALCTFRFVFDPDPTEPHFEICFIWKKNVCFSYLWLVFVGWNTVGNNPLKECVSKHLQATLTISPLNKKGRQNLLSGDMEGLPRSCFRSFLARNTCRETCRYTSRHPKMTGNEKIACR